MAKVTVLKPVISTETPEHACIQFHEAMTIKTEVMAGSNSGDE